MMSGIPAGQGDRRAAGSGRWAGGARAVTMFVLAVVIPLISGCGKMRIDERHYFAVPSGKHTNYYRLRVEGRTRFSEGEYRSGWFPARSVDRLFGAVTPDGAQQATEVRTQVEEEINRRTLQTTRAFLREASKAPLNLDTLGRLAAARRHILAYPAPDGEPLPGTYEIHYNPIRGINIRGSDEKLVFVLSADPNKVIGNIVRFAEEEKTAATVSQLANAIAASRAADLAGLDATFQVRQEADVLIVAEIDELIRLSQEDSPTRNAILSAARRLLSLLDILSQP